MMRFALCLLLVCASASGAVQSPRGWPRGELTYHADVPKKFQSAVDACFAQWQEAANGGLAFMRVKNEEDAAIVLKWVHDEKWGGTITAASAVIHNADGVIQGATISFNADGFIWHVGKPWGGEIRFGKKSKAEFTGCCLHEIGHCLGLTAHSNDPRSCMFACLHAESQIIGDEDKKRIRKIYKGRK